MDKIPAPILYEVLSYTKPKTVFQIEAVNKCAQNKIRKNPYFLQEIMGLPDNPRYSYAELKSHLNVEHFERLRAEIDLTNSAYYQAKDCFIVGVQIFGNVYIFFLFITQILAHSCFNSVYQGTYDSGYWVGNYTMVTYEEHVN